jgi:hypothetical protein
MTFKKHLEASVIKFLNDMFVWISQKKYFYEVLKL